MCSSIGTEPKHQTTADWMTKGVDHSSGMFDTDIKGETQIEKKKRKLVTDEGASTGKQKHTHRSAAQNMTSTRRKHRKKLHTARVWRKLDSWSKKYNPLRERLECILIIWKNMITVAESRPQQPEWTRAGSSQNQHPAPAAACRIATVFARCLDHEVSGLILVIGNTWS